MSGISAITGFFSGFPSGSYETTATDLAPSPSFRPAEAFNEPLPPGPWAPGVNGSSPFGGSPLGNVSFSPLALITVPANSAPLMLAGNSPADASAPLQGAPTGKLPGWDHQDSYSDKSSWLQTITAFGARQGHENSSLFLAGTKGNGKLISPDATENPGIGVLLREHYKPLMNPAQKFVYNLQKNLQGTLGAYSTIWSDKPTYTTSDIREIDEKIRSTFFRYFPDAMKKAPPAHTNVLLQNQFEYQRDIKIRHPDLPDSVLNRIAGEFEQGESGPTTYVANNKRIFGLLTGDDLTVPIGTAAHEMIHYYGKGMLQFLSSAAETSTNPKVFHAAKNAVIEGLTEHFKAQITGVPLEEVAPGPGGYSAHKLRMDWAGKTLGEDALRDAYFGGNPEQIRQVFSWGATHWAEDRVAEAQKRIELGR